jgi:membrane dipeptidase
MDGPRGSAAGGPPTPRWGARAGATGRVGARRGAVWKQPFLWLAAVLVAACGVSVTLPPPPRPEPRPPAEPLLAVVDLHVDLAFAIASEGRTLHDRDSAASIERLRRGGVSLLVLPLFVRDADALPPGEVRRGYAETYRALSETLRTSDLFLLPGEPEAPGRIATVLAFEGADGLEGDAQGIADWIRRGACLFGPVHQRTNRLAGSSQDPERARRAAGLSAAGEELVAAVYAAGGLVDVAHASDAAFDDIARLARRAGAPLIDSHTGVRALVDIDRNLDDERLRAIAASGGVAGIDLHSGHVSPHPGEPATLADVADHLMHAARIAGIEHVAIGSDFEGGIVPPSDADGEATWPRLAALLRARGWTAAQIEAVLAGNARRVLAFTFARGCGRGRP